MKDTMHWIFQFCYILTKISVTQRQSFKFFKMTDVLHFFNFVVS